MAIIYSYPISNSLTGNDLLVLTDKDNPSLPTKTVTLSTLASFVNSQPQGGIGTTDKIVKFTDGPAGLIGDSSIIETSAEIIFEKDTLFSYQFQGDSGGAVDGTFTLLSGGPLNFIDPAGAPTGVDTRMKYTGTDFVFGRGLSSLTISNAGNFAFSGQVTIPSVPVASTDAASKAYVDATIPAADVKKIDVTLSTSQLISLNGGGTLSLIPAPGAGKLLAVLNVILYLDYNSITYNFAASGLSDGVSFYIGTDKSTSINTTILNSVADKYVSYDFPNNDLNTDIQPNVAFTIQASAGMTVSQGNSPLKFSILYREVLLP